MSELNRYIIGSQKDGNIAIKCNYCDGGRSANRIGFSGVCSDRVIEYNIEDEHRVWCSNERCPCYQYHKGRITRDELDRIMATPSEFVCYESTMLSDWMTQAGLTEDGITKSFGSTLHKGAVCVFTTRTPDMAEYNRFVFGMFIIDEIFRGDSRKSGYVKCNTDYHIELTADEAKKIKFWNYYRNKNNPDKEVWGTGLYRFVSNNGIIGILSDLIKTRQNEKKDEVIRFFVEFCRLNNLKVPEIKSVIEEGDKPSSSYTSREEIANNADEEEKLIIENRSLEKEITDKNLVGIDRIVVVKARVNQGVFRDRLIRKYHKCCLCGTDEESLLIASHIKPWVDSTPEERIDGYNGLLLCPNHDKLFDRGFITFDDDGSIMISKSLLQNNRIFLNVDSDIKIVLESASRRYMKYHRENIFMDSAVADSVQIKAREDPIDETEALTDNTNVNVSKKQGLLPDGLINLPVYDDRYGDGIIVNVISRSFELEVKFDDEDEIKSFIFPSCFLSGRLSMKNEENQIALNEHLKKYKY